MYKKMLPLLLLAGSATLSFAQPILTSANFSHAAGDVFSILVCDTNAAPGAAGPGITWDFSALHATATDTGTSVSCASTPQCPLFPGSNIAYKGPGVLQHATIYYASNFLKLSQIGYYSAADTNLILSDPADQLTYPFTYGTSFMDIYSGILTLGALTAHQAGTISVNGDGYGTLILPSRTDAGVLRVHTLNSFTDSVGVFTGIVLKYDVETYDWYKPGYNSPLLTIGTVTQHGALNPSYKFVGYAPVQIAAVEDVNHNLASVKLYPNPAQEELNIDFSTTISEQVRISLLDVTGRQLAVIADKEAKGAQHYSYNTAALAKGLYIVRIDAGAETITRKVTVQ